MLAQDSKSCKGDCTEATAAAGAGGVELNPKDEPGTPSTIRLAGIVRESIVDGPGLRFAVFCQGCPHGCPGCHNPDTHDFAGGYDCDIDKIVAAVDENPLLDGITLSGGEPMCQPEAFCVLCQKIKERGLNVVTFTGYTYEELLELEKSRPAIAGLLELTDYLVDGRFEMDKRDLTLMFRGSQNQRVIDMAATREAGEMVIAEQYM